MATMLNTKIRLRYDLYTNWIQNDPVLLAGEVAIAVPGTDFGNEGQKTGVASCLMKVGNGTAKFSELPWLSAVAADVHDWAKKSKSEFMSWVVSADGPALATKEEVAALSSRVTTLEDDVKTLKETTIPGINQTVAGINETVTDHGTRLSTAEQDIINLQAAVGEDAEGLGASVKDLQERMETAESNITAQGGKIDTNTTNIENITKEGGEIDTKVAAEADRAKGVEAGLQGAIDVLNGADTENGSVAKAVKEAVEAEKTARESADTQINGRIDTVSGAATAAKELAESNEGKLNTLIGTDADKSIRTIAAEEINTLIAAADDEGGETIQKVADLVDYVEKNAGEIAGLVSAVNGHTESITTIVGDINNLKGQDTTHTNAIQAVNDKIGTAKLATTDKTLIGAINETHAKIATDDATTLQAAKDYAEGLVNGLTGADGALTTLTSRVTVNEGKLADIEAGTKVVDLIAKAKSGAEATAAADATTKANAAQAAAEATAAADAISKANQALADAKEYAEGLVTPVSSKVTTLENGAIMGTRNTSAQGETLTMTLGGTALELIFNCGTSVN